ncbi:Uncharacterized protein TCAP_00301 [Tolypocladium capitatum]|uniref:Uncharacterized protein n=1 Tax=Tolypocladium capitatum TaxID=45235 RepID=A0A2K3QQG4_9HYPO|nr:Uncharacterized protein TCAP_00301 [Tolypocladium capitatum]
MLRLDGKAALVNGLGQAGPDGRVIGAACAVLFRAPSKKPASSATWSRRDATSSASVKALVDACVVKHGRIDILLTNLGQSPPGTAASMAEHTWDSQMATNLKSVCLACLCPSLVGKD